MRGFGIWKIDDGIYDILDEGNSSFYIVEGEDRAAVIDTGISPGQKILPLIRQYTQKPLILVLTHAHIDHWYHMDEFETVYMCHREFEVGADALRDMMADKDLHPERTLDIRTDTRIELGGTALSICEVPGHTPGSVVVLDERSNRLFTGDAIGSGYGVWMQTPTAVPLETYYESLVHLLKWLVDRGGRMSFHGGHRYQMFQSTHIPAFNPPSLGLLCDLIDLVDQIIHGKIVGRISNVDNIMELEPVLYAAYGRAEIQYKASNIRI